MKLEERRRIHNLTNEQMAAELADAERDLLNLRFDAGLNRLSNPASLHNTKKRIAMLKTLLRERELVAEHGFASVDEYKVFRNAEKKAYHATKSAR
ncbi:MAG: 50S ribosomal protein L29 [Armatimonadota bacterium]